MLRARTAERYGLVHDVVAADALEAQVKQRVDQIAAHAESAVAHAKQLCQLSADSDAASSFRLEGIVQQALLAQPDLMTRFPQALAFIKAQLANPE
jgi:enoyl-CoA hydratase/carnithine racemase